MFPSVPVSGISPSLSQPEGMVLSAAPSLAVGVRSEVLTRRYIFEYELGLWTFGAMQVVKERSSHTLKLCKTVPKAVLRDPAGAMQRLSQLRELRHPQLCSISDVLEDQSTLFIVSDRVTGGDVADFLDWLDETSWIAEETCAAYISQVLAALVHSHACQIYHRDLRPSNIMLTSREPDANVMVTGLGLAAALDPDGSLLRKVQNPFCAPELRSQLRGQPVVGSDMSSGAEDIWSVGAIAVAMLLGKAPGKGLKMEDLQRAHEHEELWTARSPESLDFVRWLMKPVGDRPSAARALHHPWLWGIVIPRGLSVKDGWDAVQASQQKLLCYMLSVLLIPVALNYEDLDRLFFDVTQADEDFDGYVPRIVAQGLLVLHGASELQAENAIELVDIRGNGALDMCAVACAALTADILRKAAVNVKLPALVGEAMASRAVSLLQDALFQAFCEEAVPLPTISLDDLSAGVDTNTGRLMEERAGVQYDEVLSCLPDDSEFDRADLATRLGEAGGRGTTLATWGELLGGIVLEEEDPCWAWRPSTGFGLFKSCGIGSRNPRPSKLRFGKRGNASVTTSC